MLKFIKKLFGITDQQKDVKQIESQAPYKIEPPTTQPVVTQPVVDIVPTKVVEPAVSLPTEAKPKRAKNSKGKFVADNPNTPDVNEAWVGGKAPAKKPKSNSSNNRKNKNRSAKKPPRITL